MYLKQEATNVRSNISEPWADWSPTATYNIEDESNGLTNTSVARVGNYFYRTIANNNVGNPPEDNLDTLWVKWSVSNRYAMLDLRSTTKSQTADGEHLVVEFTKGLLDTMALGYYTAELLRLDYLGPPTVDYQGDDETTDYVIDSNAKYRPANDLNTILDELPDGAPIPTSVLNFDGFFCEILYTYTESYDKNNAVTDYYSYIYEPYSTSVDRGKLLYLKMFGSSIRVTLYAEVSRNYASCGYLVAGVGVPMGDTSYGVNFSFHSYSVKNTDAFGVLSVTKRGVQDLIDFETTIDSSILADTKRKIKEVHDEIVVFVLDEQEDSTYENIVTLGIIENVSTVLKNPVLTTIAWSIHETL